VTLINSFAQDDAAMQKSDHCLSELTQFLSKIKDYLHKILNNSQPGHPNKHFVLHSAGWLIEVVFSVSYCNVQARWTLMFIYM